MAAPGLQIRLHAPSISFFIPLVAAILVPTSPAVRPEAAPLASGLQEQYWRPANATEHPDYMFDTFVQNFHRSYANETLERQRRQSIFNARIADIRKHNWKQASWKKGVNHMTDWTDDERKVLRGHRSGLRASTEANSHVSDVDTHEQRAGAGVGFSLLEIDSAVATCAGRRTSCAHTSTECCGGLACGAHGYCVEPGMLMQLHSHRHLPTASVIVDQGSCGSCWAVAATAAIQLQAVMTSKGRFRSVLSPQQMLSCTPNLMECGGQGGCQGATAELGLDYVAKESRHGRGIHLLDHLDYTAEDDKMYCYTGKDEYTSFLDTIGLSPVTPVVRIGGWRRLKPNSAAQMFEALVTAGPVAASVVGTDLHDYSSGVIDSCTTNVIDHAVLMMGYGRDDDTGLPFWDVRNSWGSQWGEEGFFRLQRHALPGGNMKEPCSVDKEPEKGIACKDAAGRYPKTQTVCGVCGILSDTAHPVGSRVSH